MNEPIAYTVKFGDLNAADAGRAAESLRRTLQWSDPTIKTKLIRADKEAMDFGASLAIILAAPSIVALAKGISDWLARTHNSKVTVIGSDGKTIVENISARDAVSLAEKLRANCRVEEGRGGVEALPMAPLPFPARQTGRADFPHPAFRWTSRQAHG